MKRVAVTGGGGFIGSETLGFLRDQGFEIHLIGRTPITLPDGYFHQRDLINETPDTLLADIKPTHLLHLAWYVEPGRFWSAPENLDWVAASIRLTRAFVASGGRRAVFAGTCAEYDWNFHTLDERATPLAPQTSYGIAKLALYQLIESFADRAGLSFAWGRIFFPYGPHEPNGKLISSTIDALARNRPAPCTEGHQVRDFMHVADVAGALVALLESDIEGPVNVASGNALPLRALIATLGDLMGASHLIRFGERPMQPGEPPCLAAATARLHDEVGFRSSYTIREGLRHTIAERIGARVP